MDFEFSPDQELLRETVRRFLADRAPLAWVRRMYDDERGTDDEVWKGLADLSLTAILVPEEHGGLGLGMVDMGAVLEETGRAVHPAPLLSSAVGAVSLADGILLPGLATGDVVGTVALFEPGRRWEWRAPRTTATPTGEGWVLTGVKAPVPDVVAADVVLVIAADDDGADDGGGGELGVYAVEAEAPGVEVEPAPTVDGSRKQGRLTLTGAPARRIEGAGADEVAAALDRLVTGLVVDGVGTAGAVLELAVAYAREREQFGRPIGSFQAVQHLCADMLRDLELARAGAYYALWACDEADPAIRHEAATMAKAWASDALPRVGASCIQVHGGIGFTWEHDAHLFYKRLLTLQHALGGAPDHLEELARLVLD